MKHIDIEEIKTKLINYFSNTHTGFVEDADEWPFDYLETKLTSNSLKLSLIILVLSLLF